MKINIVDMNQKIRDMKLKQVSNPIFFDVGSYPKEDGLFSYEIFGEMGSSERKTQFAYIDLEQKFLSPVAYKALTDIDRNMDDVISGSRYFKLQKGQLVEDEENGETGLDFLYSIYDDLKFKLTDSRTRGEKIDVLKGVSKDRIFIDKFLIIPAYYRDFNPNQGTSGEVQDTEEINNMYAKILRNVDTISDNSFSFINNSTKYQIQRILFDIYVKLTKDELSGKRGLLQENLLGKTVDYSTRAVISAPQVNSERWEDSNIKFGYLGVPISQLLTLFYPFFLKYITDFIEIHKEEFTQLPNGEKLSLEEVYEQYSEKEIKNLMDNYIRNVNDRFKDLTVTDRNGKKHKVKVYHKDLGRPFTVTDLLYIAASDICVDKHVVYTRYPVENHLSTAPAKIKILSTSQTIPEQKLEDRLLKDYPVIVKDYPDIEKLFIDSVVINNSYTAALGADFDGERFL